MENTYYLGNDNWGVCLGDSSENIYIKLLTLGEDPHYTAVDKIIGNSSWTNLVCSECGESVENLIQLGVDEDCFESVPVDICLKCLSQAVKSLEEMEN